MPEKTSEFLLDWFRQAAPYFTTFALSAWGGFVYHIQRLRKGKRKFKMKELCFDLVVSSFAGLLTYYFCQAAGVSETMSAVLIAISGHMGTRAIAGFETLYARIVGTKGEENGLSED